MEEFVLPRNAQDPSNFLHFRPARFAAAKLGQDFAPCPDLDSALVHVRTSFDHLPVRADDRGIRIILFKITRHAGRPKELVPVLREVIRCNARRLFTPNFLHPTCVRGRFEGAPLPIPT